MSDWKSGYPNEEGYYLCLISGNKVILKFTFCTLHGVSKWENNEGTRIYEKVLWKEKKFKK